MKLLFLFLAFCSTMPVANWLIGNWGAVCINRSPCLIPVGFGLMAPSGVLMIGIALVLRDLLHDVGGWKWVAAAIAAGAALSFATSPAPLAVASAVAFTLAEVADWAVYAPLRHRSRPAAVMASQIVGAFLDSLLFVWLAFGSPDFALGTFVAKLYAGIAVAAFMFALQRRAAA